jgi:serine O-acetyltransferase
MKNFQADIDRFVDSTGESWLFFLLTKQGLWAMAEYRFSHWVLTHVHLPIVRQCLRTIGFIWHKLVEIITGIDLPSKATIGKGLYIPHFGETIVHYLVTMGDYCTVSQGVTIGLGGRGDRLGVPTIGDRVYIAPGAKIFGAIKIGNNVAIGANAVVTKDLPDNAVAVGIPAQIISYKGSQDFITIPESPPEKQAVLKH